MERKRFHLAGGAVSILGTCNLACKTCYSNSSPAVGDTYTLPELQRILDIFAKYGIQHVFLGGGEPLLHPSLPEIFAYAKSAGMSASISSNGQLITQEILTRLASAGLTHDFSVSLDGPDEKTNSFIRGRNSFVPTLRGMYELMKFGKIVWGVNFVSTKPNLGKALATAEMAQRLGASYFNLIKSTPFGRAVMHLNALQITYDEFHRERESLGAVFPRMGTFYGDIYLYDLAGVSRYGMESYFDAPQFEGVPSGISIEAGGRVDLTPSKILLGNCRQEDIGVILERLGSQDVLHRYSDWFSGKRRGVHQVQRAM